MQGSANFSSNWFNFKFFFPEIGTELIGCKTELAFRDRLRQRLHIRLHVYIYLKQVVGVAVTNLSQTSTLGTNIQGKGDNNKVADILNVG